LKKTIIERPVNRDEDDKFFAYWRRNRWTR
jgi:hypothetical protein